MEPLLGVLLSVMINVKQTFLLGVCSNTIQGNKRQGGAILWIDYNLLLTTCLHYIPFFPSEEKRNPNNSGFCCSDDSLRKSNKEFLQL